MVKEESGNTALKRPKTAKESNLEMYPKPDITWSNEDRFKTESRLRNLIVKEWNTITPQINLSIIKVKQWIRREDRENAIRKPRVLKERESCQQQN